MINLDLLISELSGTRSKIVKWIKNLRIWNLSSLAIIIKVKMNRIQIKILQQNQMKNYRIKGLKRKKHWKRAKSHFGGCF